MATAGAPSRWSNWDRLHTTPVLLVRRPAIYDRASTSQFGNKAEEKGIWQIDHIKLKNVGNQTYPINAHDFEVKDSQDITYKADIVQSGSYSRHNKLSSPGENFPPGVEAELGLLTDVNPAATELRPWIVQAKVFVNLAQ